MTSRLDSFPSLRDTPWLVALLVTLLLLTCRQIVDLDIFYHLANGTSILDAGAIPRTNPYTFNETPNYYPNPAWLFGVLAAMLHRVGGLSALVFAKAVLVLLLFVLLLVYLRRQGVAWWLASCWLWLAALACAHRFTERPQLFSQLFFACFILLEQNHRNRGGRTIFWLVPLAALWANLHSGVVLGLAWLYLCLAADTLAALAARRWPQFTAGVLDRGRRRALWVATLAATAAIFLSPIPLANWRMIAGSSDITTLYPITEYLPPTLARHPWFYALAGLLLLSLLPRPRSADPTLLLPPLAFLGLALSSLRFIPDFAIVATPLAAARLPLIATRLQLAARPRWLRLAPWLNILVPLLLVVTVVCMSPLAARYGFGVDRREFPAGAVRFLLGTPLQGKLYDSLGHSAVSMFHLYPRYRFYQTSFFQMESARIIEAGQANSSPERWAYFLDKYAIAVAFVDTTREQHSVEFYPPERWALVYFDDLSAIFLRRGMGNDPIIQAHELRVAHPAPFQDRGGMMTGVTPDEAASAVTELRRVLAWDDENHLAHLMLANQLRILGQTDEALRHYDRAFEIYPQSALTVFQRGLLRRETGELAEAVADLRRATQLQPNNSMYWNELGVALGMQEEYRAALKAFDQALQIDPRFAAARANRDHARELEKQR